MAVELFGEGKGNCDLFIYVFIYLCFRQNDIRPHMYEIHLSVSSSMTHIVMAM